MDQREIIKDSSITMVLFPELLMYSIEVSTEFNDNVIQRIAELSAQLESRKYFKFYLNLTSNQVNIVESLFLNDNTLSRYNGYTESIVKKGELSNIPLYNFNSKVNLDSDSVIKVYVLNQESRIQLLRDSSITDYTGSTIDDVVSTYGR